MEKLINDLQINLSDKSDSESDNEEFNVKFVNNKSNESKS